MVRVSMGDRLRVRDLRSSGASTSSYSSSGMRGVDLRLRVAERVTGRSYETSVSCSEGVGDGEMTRGVAGTAALLRRADMVTENGGSAGQEMAPATMRRRDSKPEGQNTKLVEWRCTSRRDERAWEAAAELKRENRPQLWAVCVGCDVEIELSIESRLRLAGAATEVVSPAA